jgi:hypothetical protein
MPISKYFKGSGEKVMADMKDRYGAKKGKSVFYATANKRKQTPDSMSGLKRAAWESNKEKID